MRRLGAIKEMFDGLPSPEKHTLEVNLEDLRRWHAMLSRSLVAFEHEENDLVNDLKVELE